MPQRVIAIANQKGGVGKSTTTHTLGQALADLGYKVLLVDMDPQASLSMALKVEAMEESIYHVIGGSEKGSLELVDITRPVNDFWLAPSDILLAKSELGLVVRLKREQVLRRALESAKGFDFILIDCPPSLGLLTINSLVASDQVIIPTQCEYLALRGIALFYETLGIVWENFNPELEVRGILPTFYDPRLIHHNEVIQALKSRGLPVFSTKINRSIRFAEAALKGETVLTYAPEVPGAEAYRELVSEISKR